MNSTGQIIPIEEVIPESTITEVQKPRVVNFDEKIMRTHPKATWDIENPPYWSHARAEQRAYRRRDREIKKILQSYQ